MPSPVDVENIFRVSFALIPAMCVSCKTKRPKFIALWEGHEGVKTATLCKRCAGRVQEQAKQAGEDIAAKVEGASMNLIVKGAKKNADA